MAFITDEFLEGRLASILAQQSIPMDNEWWGPIIEDSNRAAQGAIKRALRQRGFTAQQIEDWEDGEEFNIDIGLWWCLQKGAAATANAYSTEFINSLNRVPELKTVFVIPTDDDEPVAPNLVGMGVVMTDEVAQRLLKFVHVGKLVR